MTIPRWRKLVLVCLMLTPAFGQELSFTDITNGAGVSGPTEAGKTGGHGAAWADVDDDGLPDLYITMIWEEPMPDLFFRNKGEEQFANEGKLRGIADMDGGSHGAVFADLDNDGDYDLFNGATWDSDEHPAVNQIYQNDGSGMFSEATHPSESRQPTRGVVAFDPDGDGNLDLFAVTNFQGSDDPGGERNEFYRNYGNFEFVPVSAGSLLNAPCGQGVTDTDYDGDGDVDLFCANRTGEVNILRNDGQDFTLVKPLSAGIEHRAADGITTADIDNDGDLDVLLSGDSNGYLYTNRGNGRFDLRQEFIMTDGYMGGFADLDNDTDLDLVFAGDSKIYVNDGKGNFLPHSDIDVTAIEDPRGIAFADLDADGDLDFAVGCKRSGNQLVRNNWDAGNWIKVRLISPQGQAGAFGAKVRVLSAGEEPKVLGMREAKSAYGYLAQDDPVLHFGLGEAFMVSVEVGFITGETVRVEDVYAKQTITIDGSKGEASGVIQEEEDAEPEPE
jgi:VCBS repeat protein/ASPIC/UnbV protein